MKRERNAKQAFIEGTVRVVARDGLDKTTTKAIATEAGLSEAYIYRCFESKEALLCAAFHMEDVAFAYVRLKMECKDYILAQKTTIDALRFDPKDSELNMYAILAMGFQGNLSMAQTYYTAAKPYLALEHAEVIKKYLHIK